MPSTLPQRKVPSLGTAMENLKHRWGWFVGLGVLAMVFGAVALVMDVHATITTVYIIAVFMIIAGGTEIMVGVGSRTWGRFFLMVLAGLLYIVGGSFALAQPIKAAIVLTLMLGASLLTAGIVRIYIGTHMHSHARSLVIVGGVVTSLVGLLIILGWPNNSYAILGTLLGIDLLFTGMMWVGFGLRLKNHA
ncbi:hypothetical protein RHAL1_02168 [Beijerinckiaceae bacterium RH AL1]|nr:HdeD family acid-resistance protein [Beijerinckiaceae bacterium]VVB46200.1 hypothetical protein RHCH11_RHCH11_02125 [Beijerinckiaceae bacterium RH CH11]VVB46284.1 hypothetical protein RHAL8_02121 [Beijerinckiaceae bacterium RH AL8]VVC55253.1 hypothetical protein RHAL1_02168 [Beijerinckiaceae bacterium RH AL1]